MANTNGSDNGNSRSPDNVVCDKVKVIKTDRSAAESATRTNETLERSHEISKRYKICCLKKAEESHGLYQDILTCVTIGNHKKTEIIKTSVDEYIKKDDAVEKLINESSKLLNKLRVSMEEANNAACVMSNCIKNKLFPKSGMIKNPDLADVDTQLKEILAKTNSLNVKTQNAFDTVVTIAGIQTFTNTVSLKDFAASLVDAVKKFREGIEGNIATTSEEVTKFREELNEIIEKLAIVGCDKYKAQTTAKGLDTLLCFLCEGECDEGCIDICEFFEECCGDDQDEGTKKPSRKSKRPADQN